MKAMTREDDITLYRIYGAALCQMIRLRKDTLSEGNIREQKPNGVGWFNILLKSRETDKSDLPYALGFLDEGYLIYVKEDFLQFAREADVNIREFVDEGKLKKLKDDCFRSGAF